MGRLAVPRAAAQRDDRRVLEQEEQVVGQPAGDAVFGEAALPLERRAVRHGAEVRDGEPALRHRYSLRPRKTRRATGMAATHRAPSAASPQRPARTCAGTVRAPIRAVPKIPSMERTER